MNTRADFLFAQPSAISGVARFLDFGGTFDSYNLSATPTEADLKALYVDWVCVGDAFRVAITKVLPSGK